MTEPIIRVRVQRMEWIAEHIVEIELRPVAQTPLPSFSAGSHIDLHLPNEHRRSYSLINDTRERHRYVIAVGLAEASRGASSHIHRELRVGAHVGVTPPRNNFPLVEGGHHSILIAGGIGITPILSMARQLAAWGRSFEVHIAARDRSHLAYDDLVRSLCQNVAVHCDSEKGGEPLGLRRIIAGAPEKAELYCCGPTAMLLSFEAETRSMAGRAHFERFHPRPSAVEAERGFHVELARSGKCIHVPSDKTILESILGEGVDVDYSCRAGICGSCEAKVLSGIPDHRDSILSDQEKATNATMMICVSRCRGERLVLDL